MSEDCVCGDYTLGNTGSPGCVDLAGVTKKLFLMPALNASSVRNGIVYATTLNAAYFADKINQYVTAGTRNPLAERWYPTPIFQMVTDERGDPVYEEMPSGAKQLTSDGVRSFKGIVWGKAGSFEHLQKWKRYGCSDIAALIVDKKNQIIGNRGHLSTQLSGILIDKDSFYCKLIKGTDTTKQKIEISFDWHELEKDEDLGMIKPSDYSGVDILSLKPSYDVYGTLGTITTTSIIVSVYTSFGSAKDPEVVTGLVAADFKLFNVTDSAAVTVSTATESALTEGTYTLTFAAQTSADSMQILIKKAGLDGGSPSAVSPSIEALRATIP